MQKFDVLLSGYRSLRASQLHAVRPDAKWLLILDNWWLWIRFFFKPWTINYWWLILRRCCIACQSDNIASQKLLTCITFLVDYCIKGLFLVFTLSHRVICESVFFLSGCLIRVIFGVLILIIMMYGADCDAISAFSYSVLLLGHFTSKDVVTSLGGLRLCMLQCLPPGGKVRVVDHKIDKLRWFR